MNILKSLSGIVKLLLAELLSRDYPKLNSQQFFLVWLTLILDKNVNGCRDLFFRLKFHKKLFIN